MPLKLRTVLSLPKRARGFIKGFIERRYLTFRYRELQHAFDIASHVTLKERVTLYELSKGVGVIAEIGSYVGASACCFAASANTLNQTQIICIDTWNNDAMTDGHRNTWSEFENNTSSFSDFIVPVRGFSTDVVEDVRRISPNVDLLFIDGDHSYEGVKADWEAYKGFLRPGSIVVFHDYGWAEGVKRVVHEDVMPLVSASDQLPNMWWGTVPK